MTTEKFWTITSEHTTHTNDRSERFKNYSAALNAAAWRLQNKPDVTGVIILEAIRLVRRSAPPIDVVCL